MFNDLRTRGVGDILIAAVDGLKGLAEAIEVAFPSTTVQTRIVHLIRSSLDYTGYRDRQPVAAALRPIYATPSAEVAQEALAELATGPWAARYPTIVRSQQRAWQHVTRFFAFPTAVRRVIYTTNAIESLQMQLRKITKTRGHFPSDTAALKLLWLALRNMLADRVRSSKERKEAMNQFAILYGERFIGVAA